MRLIYNRNYLFKGVPKTKHDAYFKRLLAFAKDIDKEEDILSKHVITKYDIKKMNGTKGIFKFVLDKTDGSRCLIRYENHDDQIFGEDAGIVLLRIVSHDEQGEIGRQIEHAFINFKAFIELDDAEGDDSNIDLVLGREYMRTIYIPPDITEEDFLQLLLDEDSRYVYKPSEKQYEALKTSGPILLLGCAGSGKTLVEISKALKNAHLHINQAYFTFTKMLKDNAQSIFEKYSQSPRIKGETSFHAITDFSLERLNLNITNYFGFSRYKDWIKEASIKQRFPWVKEVGIINLWIEIRGLIKGFMGNDYFRNLEIKNSNDIFSKKQVVELVEKGIIEQEKRSQSTYHIIKSELLYRYIQNEPTLKNRMFHNDFDSSLIDQYTYMNLKSEYSRFTKDKRKDIYRFVQQVYQKHLDQEGLYDDNDLARKNILISYQQLNKPFDFVLVDEVQDLTEMQIYMLLDLAINPEYVFLSGDVSQVINPTFFHKGRSGLLFRNRKNILWDRSNVLTLNENYRNSKSIVEVANKIVEVRQDILGTYTEDIVEISKELEVSEGLPVFIDANESEFFDALKTWQRATRVAIIVSDDEAKKKLSQKMSIKHEEMYNIFTVQEAKGQEFDQVAIYNVLSDHADAWDLIMQSSKQTSTVHFQYYFNLFYVAVTRAKRSLFLYEENKTLRILERLVPLFDVIIDNVVRVMDVSEYTSEEQIISQAKALFAAEDYDRARLNYLRVNQRRNALICQGYHLLQMGRFEQGVRLLYRFNEHHQHAYKFANHQDVLLFKIFIGHRLKKLNLTEIIDLLKQRSLIDLVQNYKHDKNYKEMLSTCIALNSKIQNYKVNKKIKELLK
jgi:DNA helicase II / ATP-dependent DNA helicase PcrA